MVLRVDRVDIVDWQRFYIENLVTWFWNLIEVSLVLDQLSMIFGPVVDDWSFAMVTNIRWMVIPLVIRHESFVICQFELGINKRVWLSWILSGYEWLWPSLSQAWGNQQTVEGLFKYLDDVIMGPKRSRNSPNPLWAVMAELTPYPLDIIFKPSGGLRQMADAVNRNLTVRFQEKWWKETNIVATDFFLGNNLIDVSIQSNIKKSNIAQWRLWYVLRYTYQEISNVRYNLEITGLSSSYSIEEKISSLATISLISR